MPEPEPTVEYRIDDLARAAGTTTRNVRGYQDRGLLPRPHRRGRIAIYTDAHLARLKVINDLLRRGFTIRHIGDFLSGVQRGDDLADVLGLREVVATPWASTSRRSVSTAELTEMLNTSNPAYLQRLNDFGLIRPDDSASPPAGYILLDEETVTAYSRLIKRGLSLRYILDVHEALDRDMDAVAATVISAGRRAITEGRSDGWLPQTPAESEWATDLLAELKRAGSISAHNALDRALDRDMARQLDDYLGRAHGDENVATEPQSGAGPESE
ncbi:MerR family transcriptional regulator [Gordonia sp. NPDC003425]